LLTRSGFDENGEDTHPDLHMKTTPRSRAKTKREASEAAGRGKQVVVRQSSQLLSVQRRSVFLPLTTTAEPSDSPRKRPGLAEVFTDRVVKRGRKRVAGKTRKRRKDDEAERGEGRRQAKAKSKEECAKNGKKRQKSGRKPRARSRA
jgi:hypothetical protein